MAGFVQPLIKNQSFVHPDVPMRFELKQSAMLQSHVADQMAAECGIHPQPCMLFDTSLKVIMGSSSSSSSEIQNIQKDEFVLLDINTRDALKGMLIDERTKNKATNGTELTSVKCQYADAWGATRKEQNPSLFNHVQEKTKDIHTNTDWTFSTTYSATPMTYSATPMTCAMKVHKEKNVHDEKSETKSDEKSETKSDEKSEIRIDNKSEIRIDNKSEIRIDKPSLLPLKLLQKPDPILYFNSLLFYEDELDDSGSSIMDLKIRVHRDFFFILVRNEVRVDNVCVRRMDTRYFGCLNGLIKLPKDEKDEENKEKKDEENKLFKENKHRIQLFPYHILKEWSYSEVTFEELKKRGDLDENRPEMIMQVAEMLKPIDQVKHVGIII